MRSKITITAAMLLAIGTSAYAQAPAPTPVPPAPVPAITVPPNQAVTPAAPSATPIPGTTIALKFVPGETLKYAMNTTVTGKINAGGKVIPITEIASADIQELVKSVDANGNGTLTISTSNLAITMNLAGQSIPIPKDQLNKAPSNVTITLSPRGSLADLKLPPMPNTPPGMDVSKFFDPNMFSNLAILPDHPVNLGDIWRGGFNLALFGVNIAMKMTLNGITEVNSNHIANIGIKFYAGIDPDLTMFIPKQPGYHAPKVNGQVNGTGSLAFDLDNGYQKSGQANVTMIFSGSAPKGAVSRATNGMNGIPTSASVKLTANTTLNLVGVSTTDLSTLSTPSTPPVAPPAVPAVQ